MMKFIIDAHLPQQLKIWLVKQGFDAIHTTDLPDANETEDLFIVEVAENEGRTVVTKDSDFLKFYVLKKKPSRLFIVTTGNIVNKELLILFERNLKTALRLFETY